MKRNPKQKKQKDIEIVVNGVSYNLGKLVTIIAGYSPTSKTHQFNFKCIGTGKTFTDIDALSKHLSEHLVNSKKVILNK